MPHKDPEKRREANLASSRRYRKRHQAKRTARNREWEKRNPEKHRAQRAVRRALDSGRFIRPAICLGCMTLAVGSDGASQIQAHHEDYSKPLDVVWLCPRCHSAADSNRDRS